MHNFSELYPIMRRVIPEKWNIPAYCIVGLYSYEFSKKMLEHIPILDEFIENNYTAKTILKTHSWYDVCLFDRKVLLFALKANAIYRNPHTMMARIKSDN
jgi:hypothetical protein